MRFRDYLDELMRARGVNKSQISLRTGVSYSTVGDWFSKGAIPEGPTLGKIVQALALTKEEQVELLRLAHAVRDDDSLPDSSRAVPEPRRSASPRDQDDAAWLDRLLTSAMDPERHTAGLTTAVVRVLADAAPHLRDAADPRATARRLLDAAAEIVRGGKVNAALLAVAVARGVEKDGAADVHDGDDLETEIVKERAKAETRRSKKRPA